MTRWRIPLAAAAGAVLALLCWHWLPARQVRLHQRDFLAAVENRDWAAVRGFLSPEFHDAWGHDERTVMDDLPQAFRDFLACGLLARETSLERNGRALVLKSKIRVAGSGGPIAQYVMSESERLAEPFAFEWRRASWKPWDWKLEGVTQPELAPPI